MKKLSVIIVNYNTGAMTEEVIRNFLAMEKNLDAEIILVDNDSSDRVNQSFLDENKITLIQNDKNLGFAKAVNQGMAAASGEYILLLNSDVFIKSGSISKMLDYMDRRQATGVIGPRMLFPGGKFQSSCGRFPGIWNEFLRVSTLYKVLPGGTVFGSRFIDLDKAGAVDWVTGGCMLIRKKVMEKIGLMDENYFLGVEDFDFCYRAKQAGWDIVYLPDAEVAHHHGYSSGGTRTIARMRHDRDGFDYFMKKHFPRKKFSRAIIKLMNNMKIGFFKLLNRKNYQPRDATIAVTYQCNARCKMCNIWQIKNPASLPPAALYNLSPRLKNINLSGGEPFLRPDLPEMVAITRKTCPQAQIIISSNGLATDLIARQMEKIKQIDPGIGVRISIDGSRQTHDAIRGMDGIYDRAMETLRRLRAMGISNLGIGFTIMDANAGELAETYEFAKKMNLQMALASVQNSDLYFQAKDNKITYLETVKKGLDHVIRGELSGWNLKKWLRAYFAYGLKYYAEHNKRLLPSGAGFDSLFIDAAGQVYPSVLLNLPMGDIKRDKLDSIWNSGQAARARYEIKDKNITESWIVCTIRGSMRKNFYKVIPWMALNKLKYFFHKKSV